MSILFLLLKTSSQFTFLTSSTKLSELNNLYDLLNNTFNPGLAVFAFLTTAIRL